MSDEHDEKLGLEALRPAPDQVGLSLDQLSQAFANMLGQGADPYSLPEDPDADGLDAAAHAILAGSDTSDSKPEAKSPVDAQCEISPRSIVEALLFAGRPDNQPMTGQEIAALMRGVGTSEIDDLVRDLNEHYEKNGCPYTIASEGSGYRMTLRSSFARIRERFYGRVRAARLSPAAIEVLSLVAYKQPVTADEIHKMRNVPSGHILSQLVRRRLLRIERTNTKPVLRHYFTTPRFLEVFGLKSLDDLPHSEDLDRE